MKKFLLVLLMCTVPSFAATPATDNLWVGTWTLDRAKSHFTGKTFTYSQSSDGVYHYSDGPGNTETSFRIDGLEYKTQGTSTTTWITAGENAWETVHKADGIVVSRIHRQLSADGSTFEMTSEGNSPDGSTYRDRVVYTRVTAGKGLLGRWVSTRPDSSVPDTILILPSPPGVYHWEAPADNVTVEGELNGSDIPVKGPLISPGTVVNLRQITPHRIVHTLKLGGRVNTVGVQTLARDGKSFTDVSWVPGRKSERSTGVYLKQ